MGVMYVLNHSGHGEIAWDSANEGSLALAERKFSEFSAKGYSAFVRQDPDRQEMFRVTSFSPDADEILWVKPLVGG